VRRHRDDARRIAEHRYDVQSCQVKAASRGGDTFAPIGMARADASLAVYGRPFQQLIECVHVISVLLLWCEGSGLCFFPPQDQSTLGSFRAREGTGSYRT